MIVFDPFRDNPSMRVLIACLMLRLGESKQTFTQEDFDAVKSMGLQGEYHEKAFTIHVADSVANLPGRSKK